MKRMLINATQSEELRVVLVEGKHLYDLDIENVGQEQVKANIYKGRIARIEPSLEAVFVDYGANKNGFLPFKEIAKEYYTKNTQHSRQSIKHMLKENQEILVQIDKEERGNKGAALTTYISLAGSYLVLMPNNPKAGGVSRRIEGNERSELKELLNQLNIPQEMGVIVRTAGVGQDVNVLQEDLNILLKQWQEIQKTIQSASTPCLIHQESGIMLRAIRDYLRSDIEEILIDNQRVFEEVKKYVKFIRPDALNKLKFYQGEVPLFTYFQIETEIESAFHREVRLPSGGSIVIDSTEALTAIDINSAKATKASGLEETAVQTNIEAAEEIARQLRLRDVGGLIVIDFIDMLNTRHHREVEYRLREALKLDRAKIQYAKISRFGLLEMSRQRLKNSLKESASNLCPRCQGQGTIRDSESLALSILRLIEEESTKQKFNKIEAQVPIEVAAYLLNEKRKSIKFIETRYHVEVYIIPHPKLETPNYNIIGHAHNVKAQEIIFNSLDEEVQLYQPRKNEQQTEAKLNVVIEKNKSTFSIYAIFKKIITLLLPSPKSKVEQKKQHVVVENNNEKKNNYSRKKTAPHHKSSRIPKGNKNMPNHVNMKKNNHDVEVKKEDEVKSDTPVVNHTNHKIKQKRDRRYLGRSVRNNNKNKKQENTTTFETLNNNTIPQEHAQNEMNGHGNTEKNYHTTDNLNTTENTQQPKQTHHQQEQQQQNNKHQGNLQMENNINENYFQNAEQPVVDDVDKNGQRRSRRSFRHLRVSGQQRKKKTDKFSFNDSPEQQSILPAEEQNMLHVQMQNDMHTLAQQQQEQHIPQNTPFNSTQISVHNNHADNVSPQKMVNEPVYRDNNISYQSVMKETVQMNDGTELKHKPTVESYIEKTAVVEKKQVNNANKMVSSETVAPNIIAPEFVVDTQQFNVEHQASNNNFAHKRYTNMVSSQIE